MPQPLHVDTSQLRTNAGQLDTANVAASDQLRRNSRALASSQIGWAGTGTAYTAFEQVRETWEQADANRAEGLEDIAVNLYRSAGIYDHGDEANAADLEQTL